METFYSMKTSTSRKQFNTKYIFTFIFFIADHIKKIYLDKLCATVQASHQRHLFEYVF